MKLVVIGNGRAASALVPIWSQRHDVVVCTRQGEVPAADVVIFAVPAYIMAHRPDFKLAHVWQVGVAAGAAGWGAGFTASGAGLGWGAGAALGLGERSILPRNFGC